MPPSEALKEFKRHKHPKPDAVGYLGVPGGGDWQGTADADGYIYDIPYKAGYTYVRVQAGVEFEVGDCIATGVARNPFQKINFKRFGGTLLPMDVNVLGAVAVFGTQAPAASIPPHPASTITTGTLVHERGGLEADVSAFDGYVFISGGATSQKKAKLNGTTAPTVNEDSGDGYSIGSLWIDTTNDRVYQATDVTVGAAVWKELSQSAAPTFTDFTNAQHDHLDADDGGTLSAAAIASGTLIHERGGLEADVSAFNGLVRVNAGATDDVEGYLEALNVNLTEVANIGTGEDDLITYTVAANTLANNFDRLNYEFALTLANNGNGKQAKVYLDDTALFDSGALPTGAAVSVVIRGSIIREAQSVQKTSATMITSDATLPALANVVGCAEDLSTSLVLKVTGQATSNGDISCESLTVDLVHAP